MLVPNEGNQLLGAALAQYLFGSSCSEVSCNLTPKMMT
jgi:hypothetical protein